MQAFDASSMLHAWDHYPEPQFPGLWEWMAGKIESGEFVMSKVAFEEVEKRSPDCAKWLKEKDHAIQRLPTTNETLHIAMRIKKRLGIENDQYSTRDGVGENDILIIASAKEHDHELVSNEGRQVQIPDVVKNCRIPAVCGMAEVEVPCLDFST